MLLASRWIVRLVGRSQHLVQRGFAEAFSFRFRVVVVFSFHRRP
jgi:hypothetical protein